MGRHTSTPHAPNNALYWRKCASSLLLRSLLADLVRSALTLSNRALAESASRRAQSPCGTPGYVIHGSSCSLSDATH